MGWPKGKPRGVWIAENRERARAAATARAAEAAADPESLLAPTVEEALRRALARPIGSSGGTEATRAKIFTGAPAGARRIARACVRSHPCVLSVSLCAAGLPSWLFVILAPDGGALAGKPLPRGKWCPKAEHAAAGLLAALRGLLPHLEEVGPGDPSAHPLAVVARAEFRGNPVDAAAAPG